MMKTLKIKIEGKEWTLKVDENQIIPETDSTFKTSILILELGQVDKRIFYFITVKIKSSIKRSESLGY